MVPDSIPVKERQAHFIAFGGNIRKDKVTFEPVHLGLELEPVCLGLKPSQNPCFFFFLIVCYLKNIYLFLAVMGLYCCVSFSLVAASEDYSLVAACKLLIVVASFIAEHGL